MGDVNIQHPYRGGDPLKKLSESTDTEVCHKLRDALDVDWKEDPARKGVYVSVGLSANQAQEVAKLGNKMFKTSFKSEEFGGEYHAEVDKKDAFKILRVSKEAISEMKQQQERDHAKAKELIRTGVRHPQDRDFKRVEAALGESEAATQFIKDFVTKYLRPYSDFPQAVSTPKEGPLMHQLLKAFKEDCPWSRFDEKDIQKIALEAYNDEAAQGFNRDIGKLVNPQVNTEDLKRFQSMLGLAVEVDFPDMKISDEKIKELGAKAQQKIFEQTKLQRGAQG